LGLFSGGEAQRAKLAVALACGPELLLLDEPLSGIDQISRTKIMSCIVQNRSARSILWVEHERDRKAACELTGLSVAVLEAR
jgi:ABC-type Mn2+/Zn2+ transport system ATPase subunit